MRELEVPFIVRGVIDVLTRNYFQCYLVGGCVRDFMIGRAAKDWDLCTDATTEEIVRCYREHNGDEGGSFKFTIIPVGLKHGTVAVRCDYTSDNGENKNATVEITTYRGNQKREGKSLEEDVLHRDFTLNAIAYKVGCKREDRLDCRTEGEAKGHFIDFVNGMEDIKNRVIRAVGKADERFAEDPLRILRAIRLAANLKGFKIEPETRESMIRNRELLRNVAPERIQSELVQILQGEFQELLLEFQDIVEVVIPEMKACFGFEQHNPYHDFDVYTHILRATRAYKGKDLSVRLGLFLHDIGKPSCYTNTDGVGHFYDHAIVGSQIANKVLHDLKFDNKTINEVTELVLHHSDQVEPNPRVVRRLMNRLGLERVKQLLEVKCADVRGQKESVPQERIEKIGQVGKIVEAVVAEDSAFSIRDLAVGGKEIMEMGVGQGPEVGRILKEVLEAVFDEKITNTREDCLEYAWRILSWSTLSGCR